MDWPLFFKDQLEIGNRESQVGICTLWTEKEKIMERIGKEEYCVIGNLYTAMGINAMIKNILANPRIRYLVLCGKDMNKSGEALVSFMKNGIDSKRKIVGHEAYIDSSVPIDLVEKFRSNVKLIDMREREDEISNKISSLPELPAFMEPVFIEEEDKTFPSMPADRVCFTVRDSTIGNAWLNILDIIMKFGEEKDSEYGVKQKEIINLVSVIDGDDKVIAEWFRFNENDLKAYYPQMLSSSKTNGISYTYGERLFSHPLYHTIKISDKWKNEVNITFNQIKSIIEHLKKAPYTRRAVAFTWNIELDSKSEHPPCLTQLSWNIKNRKLYQTAVIRSNDMFGAWPLNAFALRKLQKRIAEEIGIKAGGMIIISNSAHIYEQNWKESMDILNKHFTGKSLEFETDILGYFLVSVKDGDIVVQHHLPDGRKSDYKFIGKSAIELYRKIMHEGLVSKLDHAAYLGKELARAEQALKNDKEFFQDKA